MSAISILVFQANAPSTASSFFAAVRPHWPKELSNGQILPFFCEDIEPALQAIAIVELVRTGWVESIKLNTRAWPVLVHQLLALTLQFGAISAERCWQQLTVITDFSNITAPEFDTLIAHMLREGFLYESGGLLSMGDKAEKVFGRKNFMELYAVFSSPVLYKVTTKAGYVVGSLEQAFVDKLVEEISSFFVGRSRLGGEACQSQRSHHPSRASPQRQKAKLGRICAAATRLRNMPTDRRRAKSRCRHPLH